MTVLVSIGRRVPKSWLRRQAKIAGGFITFQQNLWVMLEQSLRLAKRKADESGKIKFILTKDREDEDLNYQLEWIKIIIQGTPEQEEEEYQDTLKLYEPLRNIFKADVPKNEQMKKYFKTKLLSHIQVEDAYKRGYGAINDNNIANKILEMGILTHIELIKDYDTREVFVPETS